MFPNMFLERILWGVHNQFQTKKKTWKFHILNMQKQAFIYLLSLMVLMEAVIYTWTNMSQKGTINDIVSAHKITYNVHCRQQWE